jgi:uncharacterized protein HemX
MNLSLLFNLLQMDSTADFIGKVGFPIAAAVAVGSALLLFIRFQMKQQTKIIDFMMSDISQKFEKLSEDLGSLQTAIGVNNETSRNLLTSVNQLVSTLQNKVVPISRNSNNRHSA